MQKLIFFLLFACCILNCNAQNLTGISTKWDDAFSEWDIFTDDEDLTGSLEMRWPLRYDWTQWTFTLGETTGIIRQTFKDDPRQWNVTSGNENITLRMVFKGDFSQWRVDNNDIQFTLVSKYGNTFDDWLIREEKHGIFDIFTDIEGDPRDWIIVDKFDSEVSLAMKIAIGFLTVYSSTPKI